MRFSQRIGKRPIKTVLQVETIDDDLKNQIWNTILDSFFGRINNSSGYGSESDRGHICRIIWKEFYKLPVDEIPSYSNSPTVYVQGFIDYIRNWFYKAEWYEIYDFIEYLAFIDTQAAGVGFITDCNLALKKEVAGYRIVNDKIVQITSEEEVQEIEEASNATNSLTSVNTHLTSALYLLADRKNPDYRNSIKESISAVESFCKIITNDDNTTLGRALIEIEKRSSLHGALKSAFSSLYGYTSDAGGIRHALLETDIQIEFEDAKFMLVTCSAFINYLRTKIKFE